MNANRLIGLLFRMFARRGVAKGIDLIARRGDPAKPQTPEDRKRAETLQQTTRQAQKGLRMARRLTRF